MSSKTTTQSGRRSGPAATAAEGPGSGTTKLNILLTAAHLAQLVADCFGVPPGVVVRLAFTRNPEDWSSLATGDDSIVEVATVTVTTTSTNSAAEAQDTGETNNV